MAKFQIGYRDEDGNWWWMGGNMWSQDRNDAITLLTVGYAHKRAVTLDGQMNCRDHIRSKVRAFNTTQGRPLAVTSLPHLETYGWRID